MPAPLPSGYIRSGDGVCDWHWNWVSITALVRPYQKTNKPVLGTETLLHTKYVSERRQTCLQIQLRALREEGWLAVVIELEQSRAAFYLRLYHTRGCHFQQIACDKRRPE